MVARKKDARSGDRVVRTAAFDPRGNAAAHDEGSELMHLVRIRQRGVSLATALGVVVALTAVSLGVAPVSAQDATGHPAHIHTGNCDTLGDVVYPLSDVGPGVTKDGKAEKAGDTVGATQDIYPVEVSVTTVDAKLAAIADGNHALNVHESKDQIQNYIACGNIGGTMYGSSLTIGLEQRNNSGYTGVAILTAKGSKTVVTVYLSEGLAGEAAPSAQATPASGSTSAGAMAVTIKNFAFSPDSLEVPVGTTVTWTNQDSAAHTVTADDGSFDSGQLATGATFSQTFATAGTYAYHCANHPKMTATIVVK
jgi:plastocyanin